jgi:hypothetical protein
MISEAVSFSLILIDLNRNKSYDLLFSRRLKMRGLFVVLDMGAK